MLVTFRIPAPEGNRFMPGCLDDQVGTRRQVAAPGLQPVRALIVNASVLPGGEHAELTADIPDGSGTARVISRAGGGGDGPFIVRDDGSVAVALQVRRRDPAEAASRIRAGLLDRGWPEGDAGAMAAECASPGAEVEEGCA